MVVESGTADVLLRQAKDGESQAVEKLLALHRPEIVCYVGHRLNQRIRARLDESDIVQDAFQEAARRLPDFLQKRPMPFHLWLRQIAYDRLIMEGRRHIQADRRSVDHEAMISDDTSLDLFSKFVSDGTSPSQALIRKEAIENVKSALSDLTHSDRELLLLRIVEDMPYCDVAALLNCTEESARKRYGRALARLSKTLVARDANGKGGSY